VDDGSLFALDAKAVHDVLLPAPHGTSLDLDLIRMSPNSSVQNGLNRYRKRIFVTMGFIGISFLAVILTIYASCRPFNHYWQINPNPGNACQAAVSKPILWVSFILNVTTDVCILLLPIPMLWKSSLRTLKKFAATLVVSAGVLIVVCAILKSVNVIIVSLSNIISARISCLDLIGSMRA
jgi:hypothetical protein